MDDKIDENVSIFYSRKVWYFYSLLTEVLRVSSGSIPGRLILHDNSAYEPRKRRPTIFQFLRTALCGVDPTSLRETCHQVRLMILRRELAFSNNTPNAA